MDQKQQIVDRLKQANNILVTVSNNPSVDQLAACIGLTLAFNKMGKHATAVFSGAVPSTIEFLQPDKTIETNTDSLRDFIISLDKAKADKLRYKVEDKVVKIFITPYRTSIGEHDLEFSQGDFNVEVVLALGVHAQPELDQAITSHGRILHDATVATINVKPGGNLGSLNWLVPAASSLSELGVDLVNVLDKQLIDGQIATAFLTGIVSETKRFSNEKTSPDTMSISAQLMAAGANQQLVATKLEPPPPPPPPPPPKPAEPLKEHAKEAEQPAKAEETPSADGTLEIKHNDKPEKKPEDESKPVPTSLDALYEEGEEPKTAPMPKIQIDEQGGLINIEEKEDKAVEAGPKPETGATTDPTQHLGGGRMMLQPPSGGAPSEPGVATALDDFNGSQPANPAGSGPSLAPAVASATIAPPDTPFMPPSMTPPSAGQPLPAKPSTDLPGAPPLTNGPAPDPFAPPFGHPGGPPAGTLDVPPPPFPGASVTPQPPVDASADNARDALGPAYASQASDRLEPISGLNAQPLGNPLHTPPPPPAPSSAPPDLNLPVPAEGPGAAPNLNIPSPIGAPPPGPPPMLPPSPQ